jgi:hypothetical protein
VNTSALQETSGNWSCAVGELSGHVPKQNIPGPTKPEGANLYSKEVLRASPFRTDEQAF